MQLLIYGLYELFITMHTALYNQSYLYIQNLKNISNDKIKVVNNNKIRHEKGV